MCRARQLGELISQDKRDDLKFRAQVVEWQTRNISAMFTVAARDNKQAREINKIVKKMKLPLGDEEADSIDNRSFEEVVEQGAIIDLDSDDQPAFEDMAAMFANDPAFN